jgi:OOP family OmpA-OmpF porin
MLPYGYTLGSKTNIGNNNMKKVLIALLAASCVAPAFAGESYVGASVGRAEQKLSVEGIGLTENTTSFKFFSGYQYNQNFGAEIGYAQFGKATISGGGATASADPSAVYVAVTGTWPLTSDISAFGKVGVARDHTKLSGSDSTTSFSGSENETSAVFGVGVSYAVNPKLSAFVEYENFGKVLKDGGDNLKVDHVSVGVRFKF